MRQDVKRAVHPRKPIFFQGYKREFFKEEWAEINQLKRTKVVFSC